MKKLLRSYSERVDKFCCTLFGHHFIVKRTITSNIREYRCIHCEKEVTDNAEGGLAPLTPENKAINEGLLNFKKSQKSKKHVA